MSLGEVGWGEGGVGSGGCLVLVGAVAFGLSLGCSGFQGLGTGCLRVAVRLLLLLVRQDGGPGYPHGVIVRELIMGLDDLPGSEGDSMSFDGTLCIPVSKVIQQDIRFSKKRAITSDGSAALPGFGMRGDP